MHKSPEQNLWSNVLLVMALDARKNCTKDNKFGAERAYQWAKSQDCRLICEYAGITYRDILVGFKRIYLAHLSGVKNAE